MRIRKVFVFCLTLSFGSVLASGESGTVQISQRAQALQDAFGIEISSDQSTVRLGRSDFGVVQLTDYSFERKTLRERATEIREKFVFLDRDEEVVAYVQIEHTASVQRAQVQLLETLASNSLPLELLLDRYEIDGERMIGDLCVVEVSVGEGEGPSSRSSLYFLRGTSLVSIQAEGSEFPLFLAAKAVDEMLKAPSE
tara:strand:+ start:41651 stop:42241 length:591 start_codon:yes stop_codon:yes gene_type:complete